MARIKGDEESAKETLRNIIKDVQFAIDHWAGCEIYLSLFFHDANPNEKGTKAHIRTLGHIGQPNKDKIIAHFADQVAEALAEKEASR